MITTGLFSQRFWLSLAFIGPLFFFLSCTQTKVEPETQKTSQSKQETSEETPSARVILFLGDSLTAGYGVSRDQAFPHLVEKKLNEGPLAPVRIVNGGQSGSLSSSALQNLEFYLNRLDPALIVLTLGGNDARQGTDPQIIRENLAQALRRAQEANKKVLLGGMQIFPNLGPEYTQAFAQIYPDLAREFSIPLIPFLLEGVAGEHEFNQYDGIHPNELGHKKIAQHILPFISEALK